MQDTPELRARLKGLIVERLALPISPDELGDADRLMEDHGVDSVGLFWIVVGLDEDMGVQIGEDEFDLETFSSVDSLARFLARREE
jgi:acyl carrier protein